MKRIFIVLSLLSVQAFAQNKQDKKEVNKPKIKLNKEYTTESGLRYKVTELGAGKEVMPGDKVSVHYTGNLMDGKIFDSSVEREQPISFELGRGMVIKGWEEGIAMMKVGDKMRLIIPSELGYGQRGIGAIPANATLIFDVELMEV